MRRCLFNFTKKKHSSPSILEKKFSLIGLFLDKLYYSYSTWILNFQCLDFRKAFFRRNSVCSGTRAGSSSRVKQHTPITQPDHCSEIACACAPHDGLVFVYPLAQVHVVFCTNFQKTVNFKKDNLCFLILWWYQRLSSELSLKGTGSPFDYLP